VQQGDNGADECAGTGRLRHEYAFAAGRIELGVLTAALRTRGAAGSETELRSMVGLFIS
jgi:hypothetical protein